MSFEPDPARPSQKRAFFGLNCEFHDSHMFDELLKQQNDPLKRENVNVDMNYTFFCSYLIQAEQGRAARR